MCTFSLIFQDILSPFLRIIYLTLNFDRFLEKKTLLTHFLCIIRLYYMNLKNAYYIFKHKHFKAIREFPILIITYLLTNKCLNIF